MGSVARSRRVIDYASMGYADERIIQTVFPYKKLTEVDVTTGKRVEVYGRSIDLGQVKISVFSNEGLPYGKYPRLIMGYLTTMAKRNAEKARRGEIDEATARVVHVGKSLSGFLEMIGINGSEIGRTQYATVTDQLKRLMQTQIVIEQRSVTARGTLRDASMRNRTVGDMYWWNSEGSDDVFTGGAVVLSEYFYNLLLENPAPIDMTMYYTLNSARAMDLYLWLARKQEWLRRSLKDRHLFGWADMAVRFSTRPVGTPRRLADFRKEMRAALAEVATVWPDHGAEVTKDGVLVVQTAPPVQIVSELRFKPNGLPMRNALSQL